MIFEIDQALAKIPVLLFLAERKADAVIIGLILHQMLGPKRRIGFLRAGKIFFQKRHR